MRKEGEQLPNDLYKYIEKLRHEKKKRRQLTAIMTAMSVFVSGGVFWQLRGIGTAMTDEDTDRSSAGNIASQLSSGHELAEESLASLPSELTGSISEDTALVAESQKGYISSEDGRSRYGDWYGSPYAEWNTMFTYFCLYHAGVKKEILPYGSGCWAWSAELEKLGLIHDMCNSPPSRGDILLLDSDCDGEADRSCIVTGITDNTIKAVEGNVEGCVAEVEYSSDDECIKGYISLEDIPPEIQEEPYMPAQELSGCSASGIQVIASYPENVFPADTEMFVTDISSDIAEATAADALSADMSQVTAVAVDISFHTPDGTEIEPADDSSVSVTILLPDEKALPDGQLSLLHVDDEGGVSTVENAELTGNSAVFTAESFSVYIINLYEDKWDSWHVGDDHYVNGNKMNIDSIKNNSEKNPYIVHVYNWVDVETYDTDVEHDYFTVVDNNIDASTQILKRRNDSGSDIVEYDQSSGSYTRKGAFQAINAGSCEIVLNKGGVDNIFYLKVVDNTDVYVNTALGEIHKDKVHEYLDRVDQYSSDSYYLSDENGKRQYFKNLEGKNGYRIYVGHTVELSAYVPTWKAAGTDFKVDDYGNHNASKYLVKTGNTVRKDMGDGTTRISAVFQAVMPQYGATWAQRTGVSLKGDGIYEYFYVVVDTSPTKTINHSDIEIADGGKYVTKKKVTYPDGTQQTVETEYLAYVSGINKCDILNSYGQVVETFNNSDYWFDPQFSPGDSQYEYTSQFIVDANNNTIISQKNFRLSDSYRADFDISVLLRPSKETLYDANGDIISEKSLIGTAEDISVPSTVVHMSHQSLIDAYNKCPDHSGLDFTLRDVDFLSSAILSAKKIVEGGSLQEGTFEFLLLDNDDVNYSYVSVPVGENTVQITPVSGHYYEMYQISRPTVMGWGSSVTDGSALFNAVQAAYNSVSVNDKMYYPPDIDSKIIQKYVSGSSSALSKEAFTAILLEYINQNEPILPLNGVFTAEGDGTCIIIDRKIVSTAKNDAGGYIRFPEIVYGNTGTHNYMIREMIPAESKGYFYDKGYLDVKVDISQDEQGQLSAAIDPSQGKTFKNTAIYTLPSTGGIGVIPFIAAGSVCTIAALLLIIRRRKEMQ